MNAVLLALALARPSAAEALPPAAEPPQVVSATLANGMRVLLVPRPGAPTIAFHVMFKVGSVDEEAGKTGLAHMFEHMIFKGTQRLCSADWGKEKPWFDAVERQAQELLTEQEKGPGADPAKLKTLREGLETAQSKEEKYVLHEEYEKLYEGNGAEGLNAYTGEDRTAYLVSLPSNRLGFWMAMESERLRDPVLREFYKERDVVMEERRMRIDANPEGKLWEGLVSSAYMAHPYGHDVLGWPSDLKAMSRTDAEDFFKTHYGPNNAVAVLVGDLDPQKTLALFKKYFEPLAAKALARTHITQEPPQEGPRRLDIRFDAEPQVVIAWHKPNLPSRDDTTLQMLQAILADGRTSRFYKNLVEGGGLAASVSADSVGVGERYPNLFTVWGVPRHPHTAAELEAGMLGEIEKIQREPPTDWEMRKIRNQLAAGLIKSLESDMGMAERLAYYQTIAGDWRYPWELQERYREITPADIQAAAKRWLVLDNSTTATLVKPAPSPAIASLPPAPPTSKAAPEAATPLVLLVFPYAPGSAALGAQAQGSIHRLAERALKDSRARLRVVVRSLATEKERVAQRRSALALRALKAGGLAPGKIELSAERGGPPALLLELREFAP